MKVIEAIASALHQYRCALREMREPLSGHAERTARLAVGAFCEVIDRHLPHYSDGPTTLLTSPSEAGNALAFEIYHDHRTYVLTCTPTFLGGPDLELECTVGVSHSDEECERIIDDMWLGLTSEISPSDYRSYWADV